MNLRKTESYTRNFEYLFVWWALDNFIDSKRSFVNAESVFSCDKFQIFNLESVLYIIQVLPESDEVQPSHPILRRIIEQP